MLYEVVRDHHNNQLKRNLFRFELVELTKEQAELASGLVQEAKSNARPTPSVKEMRKFIQEKKLVAELDLQNLSDAQIVAVWRKAQP